VLILIYHFAKICSDKFRDRAFVGATIAAAFVRDSGRPKTDCIEPGGSVKHKRLGTRNICTI
jgi:hypothetical protein